MQIIKKVTMKRLFGNEGPSTEYDSEVNIIKLALEVGGRKENHGFFGKTVLLFPFIMEVINN